ncbi:hypothetical protein [Pseudomonas sp. UMAB-40]|uniref:hypothetical protein n=1 Tax=Pseudomonas sp. UMAB-40 TaxID=1365407 RepID=UPI001C586385|nr:hypothetical protein [Pseudomonas sp. UMAB-40]
MDLNEVCDCCNAELEPGQIGLCEICQPELSQELLANAENSADPMLAGESKMLALSEPAMRSNYFDGVKVGFMYAEGAEGVWKGCYGRTFEHEAPALLVDEQSIEQPAK